jgi:tRNA-specific 2-thiouridylase
VAEKVDSQDICFVNKAHYTDFVEQYLGIEPNQGLIVDSCGCVRGYHTGVHHFTIGQRKGLGLALGYPVYVRGLDPYSNTVKVGTNQDLYDKKFVVEDVNYIVKDHPVDNHRVEVKIRYSPLAIPGSLIPINQHNVMIDLDYSVRAVTPGQAAVFYQEDTVIGGGTISRVLNQEV